MVLFFIGQYGAPTMQAADWSTWAVLGHMLIGEPPLELGVTVIGALDGGVGALGQVRLERKEEQDN